MSTDFQVRVATLRDAHDIARLSGQLGYPVDSATVEDRLKVILADPKHTVLVAEGGSSILLGWLDAYLVQCVESEFSLEVAGLVVDETHRLQGIGRALMSAAEDWGRAHNAARVSIRCNTKRLETHRFYDALGFQNVKSQYTFRRPL